MVELSSSEYMTDTKLSRFTWIPFQSDEGLSYLNTTTGKVVYCTDEELRAAEEG
jgi:hypothetical protein